jgi:hypothetical protein
VLPKTELERKDKKRIVVRIGKTILDFWEVLRTNKFRP